jgi:tetratricopeptide (TPR) repeat protein
VRLRREIAATALAALLVAVPRGARADALGDLEKAHNAYVAHRYDDAEVRLRALLDPRTGGLKDPDNVADARMYLGAVLLAEGKKDEAAKTFEQLLREKNDYTADPLRVSLDAIDALTDARTRLRDELAASQAEKVRKAQEEKAKIEAERERAALRLAMLEKLASTEVVTERSSRWLALVPFGVGQFQNGQTALGWVLLSSEVLAVAGSFVGAGLSYYDQTQANDALQHNDGTASGYQQRAQQAALAGNLFAGGFFLLGAMGVLHAELTFVPEHVEVRKRAIPNLSLSPSVGPGGLGLVGTF